MIVEDDPLPSGSTRGAGHGAAWDIRYSSWGRASWRHWPEGVIDGGTWHGRAGFTVVVCACGLLCAVFGGLWCDGPYGGLGARGVCRAICRTAKITRRCPAWNAS